jgi:glycine/D-amino acid oxidase-like deaminating enzyme
MVVDYLIIGQGISGTWLSYYLEKANKSFFVIDNDEPSSASRVAAGIINPVTGRRIVKTWMIDELLSVLIPAYTALGNELNIKAIEKKKPGRLSPYSTNEDRF